MNDRLKHINLYKALQNTVKHLLNTRAFYKDISLGVEQKLIFA